MRAPDDTTNEIGGNRQLSWCVVNFFAVVECIYIVNTSAYALNVDIRYELKGAVFVWNDQKARLNILNHDGITFEQAAEVFFDPFLQIEDASRNDEARDAVIGHDLLGRVLFVVHIELEDDVIRIISARKATAQERERHDL